MHKLNIHTRRDLLSRGLGAIGIGSALPHFLVNSAMAGPKAGADEPISVALLMTGGHDGLCTVPPYAHEAYYQKRKITRIDEKDVLKLNDEVGLHPHLAGLKKMHDNGEMATILGTAYPNYNLSHFISRDYWEAGAKGMRTGKKNATGWLGRYLDLQYKGNKDPKLSMAVGPGRLPLSVVGKDHPGLAFSNADSFSFTGDRSPVGMGLYGKLNMVGGGQKMMGADADLQFVARAATNANSSSKEILDMLDGYETEANYPDTQFGHSLKTIAALIGKGLSTRVYYAAQGIAKFGGYDTHAEQRPRHNQLMTELNDSVTAFYQDLKKQGNAHRVLTFTFSDFGRRVAENYSGGTDHGLAQPMFIFGPGVKPGVHGTQPSLEDKDIDDDGNLKMQHDFRSVYASILKNWLHTDPKTVLKEEFPEIKCVKPRS